MHIYGFTNQKGGVGKTTSCVNIGAGLALTGRRVLLVDLDPQGNLTTSLGLRLEPGQRDIYHVLSSQADHRQSEKLSILDVLINRPLDIQLSGRGELSMDIAPAAPLSLASADTEFANAVSRETILKRALEPVKDQYDYILIDCSPSLGMLTFNAMTASDKVIVPVQSEFLSLEGMAQILTVLEQLKPVNPDLSIAGILVTMFDQRLIINREVKESLFNRFGELIFQTPIRNNVTVSEAPSAGLTIYEYDSTSYGAADYLDVVKELVTREVNYAKAKEAVTV